MLRAKRVSLASILAFLIAGAAWGQSGSGSVRGVVQDQTGAVIPDVSVVLVNTATNAEAKTVTNGVGLYVYPSVVPGAYKLAAEHPGMNKFEGTLTVRVNESETVNVTLSPATTATTVEVQDVTPMVKTDSPELGQTLETRRIQELPINGRNVMNLLATIPGTTFDNSSGAFRTFGERPATHDITIDGAPLTDMVYGEQTVNRPPGLESIQEFTVETNATPAWSSRPTDIVMVTKSGSNDFHGSLFETNRDNGYGVARAREDGNTPAKLIRNEFGGSAGGPVYIPKIYNGKNKTFWFFSLEDFRQRTGSFGRFRVPTDAMRNGDFTNDVDKAHTLQKIYNPYTTDPVTHLRQQFAYNGVPNTIDPALMSPLYKYILSAVPEPNQAGVNPFLAPNYFAPRPNAQDQGTWVVRIDQRLGDKDQLYGRISDATSKHAYSTGNSSTGLPTLDKLGNFRLDNSPNKSLSADWTHTFSPTLFNEAMFTATRTLNSTSPYGDPTTVWDTTLGLPNPANQPGFPTIGDIGLTSGSNYLSPATVRAEFFNYFILEDNATKLMGKHEFRFGAHLRYDQLTYLPQQIRAAGAVSFPKVGTAQYDPAYADSRLNAVLNTGSVAASAFIGDANYNYRLVKGKYYLRRNEDALYFQDNIRLSKRLTLNLGVRWDYNPWPKDKNGVFSSFDLKNDAIVLSAPLSQLYAIRAAFPGYIATTQAMGAKYETPQQAGLPQGLANNNWHDIGPHFGFAYRALEGRKSFVVRGGYALSYYPIPLWGWNDRMKLNAPFTADLVNNSLTNSAQSPDGIANYGLISVPSIIAGKNSANAINTNQFDPGSLVGNINEAFFDPNEPSSRVHTWNLTIEKELVANTVLRISYQGNHGARLDTYYDLNQPLNAHSDYNWYVRTGLQEPTGLYSDPLIRPLSIIPYSDIQQWNKEGWSNANGGTVELQRRLTKGVGFQLFYQLVNATSAGGHGWYSDSSLDPVTSWPVGEVPTDPHQRMKLLLYGRDATIPRQEVRFNWIVELPFGRGRWLGHNIPKYVDAVVGGWQLSGMGRFHDNVVPVLNANTGSNFFPTGVPVEYYGHKYPIQDCRSGVCQAGYLLTNGYIPAFQINQPDGIMGVPANYKAAVAPINPYPANYPSIDPSTDPNYDLYGTNLVNVGLKDGSVVQVAKGDVNPYINNYINSSWISSTDASLFKTFKFKESMNLKVQADFFNVFNQPGVDYYPLDDTGVVLKDHSMNGPRTLQLSARFTW